MMIAIIDIRHLAFLFGRFWLPPTKEFGAASTEIAVGLSSTHSKSYFSLTRSLYTFLVSNWNIHVAI